MAKEIDPDPELGARRQEAIESTGLSPEKLADELKVSRPTIYNWQDGCSMRPENAKKLARRTGYPTWYLMGWDRFMEEYELQALEGARVLSKHDRATWFSLRDALAERGKDEGTQSDSPGEGAPNG